MTPPSSDESSAWDEIRDDLSSRKVAARAMGGPEKLAKRARPGRLDARARIAEFADAESFTEIGVLSGPLPADAFVAGVAMVDGSPVAVGAEDFSVAGGSIGPGAASKRHRLVELAVQERMPLVLMLEGAGHRPPRPGDPQSKRGPNDLQAQASASGLIPMAVAVLGPSAGHGALSAPLSDFTVMTPNASIFTAGPPLVKASIGEDLTPEELGGPDVALTSGVIHNAAGNDADALGQIRRWLSYLPGSAWEQPPGPGGANGGNGGANGGDDAGPRLTPEVADLVPRNPRQAYDMSAVIEAVTDRGSWFEIQPRFGSSMLTGLARLGGRSVAIVANQPSVRAGTIDADAADKAAHFIQVADSFHVPLIFLTDNPGVMAGSTAERSGILRHAGRMFACQHAASVPKVQLTLRKAYGFGSSAMSMNPFDNQSLNLAFPGVTFGAMPSRGADAATHASDAERDELREAELASGYRSAAGLSVDDLIDPVDTRNMLLAGLGLSQNRARQTTEPKRRGAILR